MAMNVQTSSHTEITGTSPVLNRMKSVWCNITDQTLSGSLLPSSLGRSRSLQCSMMSAHSMLMTIRRVLGAYHFVIPISLAHAYLQDPRRFNGSSKEKQRMPYPCFRFHQRRRWAFGGA